MNLAISPYDGVGPIKLGMTPAEIRHIIGGEYKSFMKTVISEFPTDAFIGKGLHIYYEAPGLCEAIELHPPAVPTFRGQRLIGLPFPPLALYFQQQDPSVQVEGNGLTSRLFGINLYVPELRHDPNAPVKAVLVFERGYYEKPLPAFP